MASKSKRRAQRKRSFEHNYTEAKAEVMALAEAKLAEHGIIYDRIQFCCFRREDDFDALVYVWRANAAQIMGIDFPAEPDPAAATEETEEPASE